MGKTSADELPAHKHCATFASLLAGSAGSAQETTVELDTKIAIRRQPPGPFKGLVKGKLVTPKAAVMHWFQALVFLQSVSFGEDWSGRPCDLGHRQLCLTISSKAWS